jgi:hypothetical protein
MKGKLKLVFVEVTLYFVSEIGVVLSSNYVRFITRSFLKKFQRFINHEVQSFIMAGLKF